MWKFFREENGKILPNANDGTELICDAFVWVKRQNPDTPGMTILARTGTAKSVFGRPRGESIERSWRFTKRDAVAAAVFAAQQISPTYGRFAPDDDRVSRAIAAANSGDKDALETASNAVALAASDAREVGDEAAVFAAESARAAVLAAWAVDAGAALHVPRRERSPGAHRGPRPRARRAAVRPGNGPVESALGLTLTLGDVRDKTGRKP